MIVHAIHPTPVCVLKFDPSDDLLKFLTTRKIANKFNDPNFKQVRDTYGAHSEDLHILRNKECDELRKFIYKHALVIAREVLGFDISALAETISWISVKNPNEHHTPHVHPNSFISGVYYFEKNVEHTPIVFHRYSGGMGGKLNILPGNYLPDKDKSTFAADDVAVTITTGDLILFPSHLTHSVLPNLTEEPRHSLAFNLLPENILGSGDNLTLFEYTLK